MHLPNRSCIPLTAIASNLSGGNVTALSAMTSSFLKHENSEPEGNAPTQPILHTTYYLPIKSIEIVFSSVTECETWNKYKCKTFETCAIYILKLFKSISTTDTQGPFIPKTPSYWYTVFLRWWYMHMNLLCLYISTLCVITRWFVLLFQKMIYNYILQLFCTSGYLRHLGCF